MANTNLIDDYLANRMNEAERKAFEQKLNSDESLRQEYNFQKDVVKSINNARKAELKSMLNNTPVPAATGQTYGLGTKIAIGIVSATIIVAGALYLFDEKEELINQPAIENQAEDKIAESVIEKKGNFEKEEKVEKPQDVEVKEPPVTEPTTPSSDKKKSLIVESEDKPVMVEPEDTNEPIQDDKETASQTAEINTPSVLDFEVNDDEGISDINQPNAQIKTGDFNLKGDLSNSTIEVITNNSKKKYKFHYQFMDEKLYLYGDFDEDLYQILEFNNEDGRTIILNYKESYYLLDQSKVEITPLKVIENKQLVSELDRLTK